MNRITILLMTCLLCSACNQLEKKVCGAECAEKKSALQCKLSSEELQNRKESTLSFLQAKVKSTIELENGYQFNFEFNEAISDSIHQFIKSESACCPFFSFQVSYLADQKGIELSLFGNDEVKSFIKTELMLE